MRIRSLIGLVCLALLTFTGVSAEDTPSPNVGKENVWITSIVQIGDSDQFAAGSAQGLLLRESTVQVFQASDPAAFLPDGQSAFSTLYKHPAAVWCIDSTSDGKTLASVDYRGNLVVYDVTSKQAKTHEKVFERWCQTLLVAPGDATVVAGNEAGKLMQWDLKASKVTKSVELDEHAITGLAFSPDGKHLAASDGAGHIHLLKWPSMEKSGKIKVSEETVWCVAFSNDGAKLFSGSSDRNIYSCEAKADATAESIAKGKDWITRIAISKSGQLAASEVGGRLHFPSLGGTDSIDATSGVWALCWNGKDQLIAGTRKDGLVAARRSWKWKEAKAPEPEPAEEPAKEAEDAEPKKEMTEGAKKPEPAKEKAAEPKKPAKEAAPKETKKAKDKEKDQPKKDDKKKDDSKKDDKK